MIGDEETSPWTVAASRDPAFDPAVTPAAGDSRADAAMMLFESYVTRYQVQALELRRKRR